MFVIVVSILITRLYTTQVEVRLLFWDAPLIRNDLL